MSHRPQLEVFPGPHALALEAAHRLTRAAASAAKRGQPFRMALAGGSTPLRTYRLLGADPRAFPLPWPSTRLFWGDERFVPLDDPQSNYRAACEALLDHLPRPPAGVFPVPTSAASPDAAAEAYQATLQQAFALSAGEVPRFDLVLLGLGADGHTASLFPGALPTDADPRLVAGVRAQGVDLPRITLTPRTLNNARQVIFLVSGAQKAAILQRVLQAEAPDATLPATWIRPLRGKLIWMADEAAAAHRSGDVG